MLHCLNDFENNLNTSNDFDWLCVCSPLRRNPLGFVGVVVMLVTGIVALSSAILGRATDRNWNHRLSGSRFRAWKTLHSRSRGRLGPFD